MKAKRPRAGGTSGRPGRNGGGPRAPVRRRKRRAGSHYKPQTPLPRRRSGSPSRRRSHRFREEKRRRRGRRPDTVRDSVVVTKVGNDGAGETEEAIPQVGDGLADTATENLRHGIVPEQLQILKSGSNVEGAA